MDNQAVQEFDAKNLYALGESEWGDLRRLMLAYFPADRKRRSTGITEAPQFAVYEPRVIYEMVVALRACGMLEKSGARSDAAYSLTPIGVFARDYPTPIQEQPEGEAEHEPA